MIYGAGWRESNRTNLPQGDGRSITILSDLFKCSIEKESDMQPSAVKVGDVVDGVVIPAKRKVGDVIELSNFQNQAGKVCNMGEIIRVYRGQNGMLARVRIIA